MSCETLPACVLFRIDLHLCVREAVLQSAVAQRYSLILGTSGQRHEREHILVLADPGPHPLQTQFSFISLDFAGKIVKNMELANPAGNPWRGFLRLSLSHPLPQPPQPQPQCFFSQLPVNKRESKPKN